MKPQSVSLRPVTEKDAPKMAELANNKKIWDKVRDQLPHPYHIEDARTFMATIHSLHPTRHFAICSKGEFCGMIGLELQTDVYRLSAELGYWIGEPWWGQGIATEAVRLMTQYAWETLGVERLYAVVFANNPASMHVLEKCGFEKEGISRRAVIKNGKMMDEVRYAILNPHSPSLPS